MNCADIRTRLGELIDGELDEHARRTVEEHVDSCDGCRGEYTSLKRLAGALARPADAEAPAGLWDAIEYRLDHEHAPPAPIPLAARPPQVARFWRPWATAAVILLAIGLGWGLFNTPGSSTALAQTIDFTPLLNRVGDDLEKGLRALLETYGGYPTTLADAARTMRVRVHPPDQMPGDLTLKSTHMLNMGNHESLTLHFGGPAGDLLILQCPPRMRKEYGPRECLPCQVGARPGESVREGPWRLVHVESDNVCICVISKLDDVGKIQEVLDALQIEY